MEDIENELLAEVYGVDFNYEDALLSLEKRVVCPLCQVGGLEDGAPGMVRCIERKCGSRVESVPRPHDS